MSNTLQNSLMIPASANYVQQGQGSPIIMIHGLAASLHDWDDLMPELAKQGYSTYALDLLGHGDSPKLNSRTYRMEWLYEHFVNWIDSLKLTEPAIVIGHSLGGYIALEYARRVSAWTRGLILVNPFYSRSQLPFLLRNTYSHANISSFVVGKTPQWLFRMVVDFTSMAMGHSVGSMHSLPEHIRAQTAIDFTRTAPGVYHIPNVVTDMSQYLNQIDVPTLVLWGDRDTTLEPASFPRLVSALPKATGEVFQAGHVPHQSNAALFNQTVVKYLSGLK
jgi:pimeloyl-ACP methyl ester carboxylesterase